MKRNKLIAATVAASLAIGSVAPTSALAAGPLPVPGPIFGHGPTWVPFAIMGCAGGIILAALAANARDNRELTAPEAWSCGTLFWFSPPVAPHRKRHR
jgi:hypothetical protein